MTPRATPKNKREGEGLSGAVEAVAPLDVDATRLWVAAKHAFPIGARSGG